MFPVKGESVIVRLPGALRSSSSLMQLHRAGDGAVDDGRSGSYPRVGYRIPCVRPGAFLGLEDGRQVLPGHITSDGSSPPWPHPRRCAAEGEVCGLQRRDLATDGPQECRHFASNGSYHHGQLLAGSAQPTIPSAQPELGFPSDVAHRLRQSLNAGSQCFADPGGIAICPSGFDQGPPRASIARKRQPLASHHVAGRALCRHQSEKRHQLSRRVEPAHIADFRGEGDGDQERGTAHCLIRRNHRRHGPTGHDDSQLLFQAMQSLRSVLDRVDAFLEDDLLRRMLERLLGQPTPMCQRPMTASAVDPPTTQQERKQLLAFATQIIRCCLARPDKITDRLVRRVGYPYRSKLSRPVQPRQCNRIPPIGFNPLTRTLRDQSRGNHHAVVTQSPNLPIQLITGGTCFEADMEPIVACRQLLDQPPNGRRAVLDLANKPNFTSPPNFGDRRRVLLLRDVERHKQFAILSHGPPSVREALLGLSEQPSFYGTKGRTTDLTPGT